MVKRTLFIGSPAYLSTKHQNLVISYPDKTKPDVNVPIEDIGYIILENQQITITNGLLGRLVENQTAVITCNKQHMPFSFLQPLVGHSEQTERMRHQLNASNPLKKNLWQQTVTVKIENQAHHLAARGKNNLKLLRWAKQVKSGDNNNREAIAAASYFQSLFYNIPDFSRNQKGVPPNNLLNYGYAILRAITARALVASGMLPSVGIFHKNKYNAFCLADDVMEPYRPFVDALVLDVVEEGVDYAELTTELKGRLLTIPTMDVLIKGKKSPLMVAMSQTTNSLYECFSGDSRKLLYPEFI